MLFSTYVKAIYKSFYRNESEEYAVKDPTKFETAHVLITENLNS